MSVSRHRLAPGQSRVSTASAFGRIGLLLAAAMLTIPASPAPRAVAKPAIEAPHRLACLVLDQKAERCQSAVSRSS